MNRRALIFGAVGSILLLLLWYFLLWSPRQSEIEAAQQRTAAAEQQAATLESEITRLQEAQRDEPLKQARRAQLQAAAPDDPALGQFILDVNAAANASGIEFMTISQTPPAPSETGIGLSVITLTFSIEGGYFQVLDFMNRLTDLPRLVVIDSVSLSPSTAGRVAASLGTRMFTTATGIDPTTTTTTAPPATTTTAAPPAAEGTTQTTSGGRPSPVPTAPPAPQ